MSALETVPPVLQRPPRHPWEGESPPAPHGLEGRRGQGRRENEGDGVNTETFASEVRRVGSNMNRTKECKGVTKMNRQLTLVIQARRMKDLQV